MFALKLTAFSNSTAPGVLRLAPSVAGPVTNTLAVEMGALMATEAPVSENVPFPLIGELTNMPFFAVSDKALVVVHVTGDETVMFPASAPGLPTNPVEIWTFAAASWVTSVVVLINEVAIGV